MRCVRCNVHVLDARVPPLGDGVVERDAGTATEGQFEAAPEATVHPAVHDRVVAAVAHCKPVARDPDWLDELERVDARLRLAQQRYRVERQPTQTVDDHDRDRHLDQL